MKISNVFSLANQWFYETPERALDQAYRSALKIKDIEDRYFNGQKVSWENAEYSLRVIGYLQAEVKNYLQIIRLRSTEFNLSSNILNLTNFSSRRYRRGNDIIVFSDRQSSLIVEKLEVIEEVTAKYLTVQGKEQLRTPVKIEQSREPMNTPGLPQGTNNQKIKKSLGQPEKTNVVPRTLFSAFDRIKQEIDPESAETEEELIRQFRESRYQTGISIKFILILIIVPILVYQLSKTFVIKPALNHYFANKEKIVFINQDLQKEAMEELKDYKEMMEFQGLIGLSEPIHSEEKEKLLKEKAEEISKEYQYNSMNAISNIFADTLAFLSIIIVLLANKRELDTVRKFFNKLFYNLSDSAKAFILILFTDIFVGFHSPHGWEVVLASFFRHFGLPENHDFSNIFIATFPVILDTVFKYWIFRYLNGFSPSSVATYKNMNE